MFLSNLKRTFSKKNSELGRVNICHLSTWKALLVWSQCCCIAAALHNRGEITQLNPS